MKDHSWSWYLNKSVNESNLDLKKEKNKGDD